MKKKAPICDRDCFNCPYEGCINDVLVAEDYRAVPEDRRERTREENAIAAKRREYYEANRDAIAAKRREYYEANRDAIAAKRRLSEHKKRMDADIAARGLALRKWRKEHGLTQIELAATLGLDNSTVARWETGRNRIPTHVKEMCGI